MYIEFLSLFLGNLSSSISFLLLLFRTLPETRLNACHSPQRMAAPQATLSASHGPPRFRQRHDTNRFYLHLRACVVEIVVRGGVLASSLSLLLKARFFSEIELPYLKNPEGFSPAVSLSLSNSISFSFVPGPPLRSFAPCSHGLQKPVKSTPNPDAMVAWPQKTVFFTS